MSGIEAGIPLWREFIAGPEFLVRGMIREHIAVESWTHLGPSSGLCVVSSTPYRAYPVEYARALEAGVETLRKIAELPDDSRRSWQSMNAQRRQLALNAVAALDALAAGGSSDA